MTRVETREFYEAGYALDAQEAERMGRWRAIGARSKAAHVHTLLERNDATRRGRSSRSVAATARCSST